MHRRLHALFNTLFDDHFNIMTHTPKKKSQKGFWTEKTLSQLNNDEWEALCDGCAKCCLHKLEDEDTGEIAYTNVACMLLDIKSCRCKKYPVRKQIVPDCIALKTEDVSQFKWLPHSCAYRCVAEGRDLPSWHPLLTGDPQAVHHAGASVRKWAISENVAGNLEDHIIHDIEYNDEP